MSSEFTPKRDIASKIGRRVTQWRAAAPANVALARPLLSISFDDFPVSAALAGAEMLEAHGARGAFYASAGLRGENGECGVNFSREDLLRLASAGHEIGTHGYAHFNNASQSVAEACADYARNAVALKKLGHAEPLETLAFPYGETSFALKKALAGRYRAARGILPGLNHGRVDRMQLRAFPFYGDDAANALRPALERAAETNAWLIVFTHDVAHAPSPYGATPRALDTLLAVARRLGFDVAPIAEAAALALSEEASCAA